MGKAYLVLCGIIDKKYSWLPATWGGCGLERRLIRRGPLSKRLLMLLILAMLAGSFAFSRNALANDNEENEPEKINNEVAAEVRNISYQLDKGAMDPGTAISLLISEIDTLEEIDKVDIESATLDEVKKAVSLIVQEMPLLPNSLLKVWFTGSKAVVDIAENAIPYHLGRVMDDAKKLEEHLDKLGLTEQAQDLENARPYNNLLLKIPEGVAKKEIQVNLPVSVAKDLIARNLNLKIQGDGISFLMPAKDFDFSDGTARVAIIYKEMESKDLPNLDANLTLHFASRIYAVKAYRLAVNGASSPADFSQRVRVALSFDLGKDSDPARLGAFRYDETRKRWIYIKGVNATAGIIELHLENEGIYAVIDYQKTFEDIQKHWAKTDIEAMAARQIAIGVTTSLFMPDEPLSRAQFTALLLRSLNKKEITPTTPTFKDVNSGDWFYGAVEAAYRAGLVSGKEKDIFAPRDNITREEMVVMLARALKVAGYHGTGNGGSLEGFRDYAVISDWAKGAFASCQDAGINLILPDGNLHPRDDATRAQAMVMLKGFYNAIQTLDR